MRFRGIQAIYIVGGCAWDWFIITDTLPIARDSSESVCTYLDLHDFCSSNMFQGGDNRSFIFVFLAKLSLSTVEFSIIHKNKSTSCEEKSDSFRFFAVTHGGGEGNAYVAEHLFVRMNLVHLVRNILPHGKLRMDSECNLKDEIYIMHKFLYPSSVHLVQTVIDHRQLSNSTWSMVSVTVTT